MDNGVLNYIAREQEQMPIEKSVQVQVDSQHQDVDVDGVLNFLSRPAIEASETREVAVNTGLIADNRSNGVQLDSNNLADKVPQ